MNDHYVINLGRQLGSGGKEIGEKLAKALNIAFFDKELIKLASDESGLCKEFFEKADERAQQTMLGGLFSGRFPFVGDGTIPYGSFLNNDSLFKIQSDVIRQLAENQSCLFVGRCADYILRDREDCLHVFIHADMESRIKRIVEEYKEDTASPEKLLKEKDKRRRVYYKNYTGQNWGDINNYHIVLDSGYIGIEECAEIIARLAKQ